ncbi:hypothetical protein NC652_020428 [Populus alba x Populus x berolinensis]|uniref:Uncharacterized protein n=1 Tax=Populus alba x Populus x berolinensis TaxID=444605 RepID=A0AAD6QEA8_9ROSI|nr:hypothetical protein NC652_020428 [Populus alba x Populus x berolinensis]KAJ6986963.1 hypothetical protein NC653_020253 [Populus alba x Populus x berolinensis]
MCLLLPTRFSSLSSWKVCADEIIYELSCDSCS